MVVPKWISNSSQKDLNSSQHDIKLKTLLQLWTFDLEISDM